MVLSVLWHRVRELNLAVLCCRPSHGSGAAAALRGGGAFSQGCALPAVPSEL